MKYSYKKCKGSMSKERSLLLKKLFKKSQDSNAKNNFWENIGRSKEDALSKMLQAAIDIDNLKEVIRGLDRQLDDEDTSDEKKNKIKDIIREKRVQLSKLNERKRLVPEIWNLANKDNQITANEYYEFKRMRGAGEEH